MIASNGGTERRRREHGAVHLHPRVAAYAALVALTVPFGVAVHLLAELAAAGGGAVCTAHHLYLFAFVVAAFALVVGVVRIRRIDRRYVALISAALPWHGRGAKFVALLTFAQLVFFALTIAGEGSPLVGGNLVLGFLVALGASTIGSFIITSCATRVLRAVADLVWFLTEAQHNASPDENDNRRVERAIVRMPFSLFVPNRPPPVFLALQP